MSSTLTLAESTTEETIQDIDVNGSDVRELDEIWDALGGFGKFQFVNIACISLVLFLFTMSDVGYALISADLKHRCLIAECEGENAQYDAGGAGWLHSAVPTTSAGVHDSCRRYNTTSELCANTSLSSETFQCNSFVYETKEWTIHREDWNMHCSEDRTWLHLVGTLNIAGHILGSLYQGYLQDKYGRKTVLVSLALIVVILGTIKSFSINFYMFAALETLEGQAAANLYYGPFVLALESVAPSQRAFVGLVLESSSIMGQVALAVAQYLTFDWRTTLRICYLPFLMIISFFWILPESIRWLLMQQRYDDAAAVLKRIAKMNGKEYPEKAAESLVSAESAKINQRSSETWQAQFISIWKSKILRWRFFANLVMRMSVNFVYYGMTLQSVSLSDSKFLDFSLSGVAELPGYLSSYYLMDRIGRKSSLWIYTLISLVACVSSGLIDAELHAAKLTMFLIGKCAISGGLSSFDVLTIEMFPTLIRSTVVSTNIMVGKIITIALPLVPLLADFFPPLPLLLFGAAALIGLCTIAVFPETLGTTMPDTVEEAENLSENSKATIFPRHWNPKTWCATSS